MPPKPDTSPAPMAMVKSNEKECKFFFRDILECCRNTNFKEIDTDPLTEKNHGFCLLLGIFKECINQNTIMAALRKAHSHSDDICGLIRNQ